MTWKPSTLTRTQMEERRLAGGRLLKSGQHSQAEIARQVGVSRTTVSEWSRRLEAGGMRKLRRRIAPGRASRLSREQQQTLTRLLKQGARAADFPTARWTLQRVQQLIEREFDVTYHPNYLNRLLRRLGWSRQRPLPRAVEREEALVRVWLKHDWPRIKKGAAEQRRDRVLR